MKRILCLLICAALLAPALALGEGLTTDFSEKFADKFMPEGMVSSGEMSYASDSVYIEITKDRRDDTDYFVADIYVKSIESFRRAFSSGKWNSTTQSVDDMATANGALLAMTGDYANNLSAGTVVLNGEAVRTTKNSKRDLCFLMNDGTLETYLKNTVKAADIVARGVWQSFLFGPRLLDDDGNKMTKFNSDVGPANPRAVIGYYEPGHYCFVLVDGRSSSNKGMTLKQLSALMDDLGCAQAYNLDGGQSAILWFNGKVLNEPYKGGRRLSDIVYIAQ